MWRTLLNFTLAGIITIFASFAFPQYVYMQGGWTMLMIAVALALVRLYTVLPWLMIMAASRIYLRALAISCGILMLTFVNILAFYTLSAWFTTFEVIGFWPKVILSLVISCFTISKYDLRHLYP